MLMASAELGVVAHGTWGNFSPSMFSSVRGSNYRPFQLHWALLAIMAEGSVNAGDGGMLLNCSDSPSPLNAADYGPFYVIFEPGYRNVTNEDRYCGFSRFMGEGPSQRDDHKAYLIPDDSYRPFFEKALHLLAEYRHLSDGVVQQELRKLLTYQEWIERGGSLLSKGENSF